MAKCSGVTGFVKTCGDCIHADICEHNPTIEFNRENIAGCGSFRDKDDFVEVRRGKWELHDDGSATCLECGCRQLHIWDFDNYQNFCGHCGADMKEV